MQIKNTMGYDSVDSWVFFIFIILSTNVILVNCFFAGDFFFLLLYKKKPIEIQLNFKRSTSLQKIETNSYTIFIVVAYVLVLLLVLALRFNFYLLTEWFFSLIGVRPMRKKIMY